MTTMVPVEVYFNFRSPYCYLASKNLFALFDEYHAELVWKPLGGWAGRSPPERAKVKMPLVRQDVKRHTRLMGIPFSPPPVTTDPTRAGAGSLLAEREGLLRPYVVEVMRKEWAEGRDIGDLDLLLDVAVSVGLDRDEFAASVEDPAHHRILESNWLEAQDKGAFGVPSFIVGEDIFWGNDRIDFVRHYLHDLGLRRI